MGLIPERSKKQKRDGWDFREGASPPLTHMPAYLIKGRGQGDSLIRMKIAIIGGSGKMGRWFADFLLKDGKEVVITGRNEEKLQEARHQLWKKT